MRDEGYDIEIRSGRFLLLKSVPYVNAECQIRRGVLVTPLTLAGDATTAPADHVVMFIGEHPCREDGTPIPSIRHSSSRETLDRGLVVDHRFSNKAATGPDKDFYEKMVRYVTIISGYAQVIDPTATAKVNRFVEPDDDDSVFVYADTASSNDGIAAMSRKLEISSVAIIGLGGTGSYVLDLVAKTPVKNIHLFDGEPLLQHNAFRCPGAAPIEVLRAIPDKVEYLKNQYAKMHKGIVPHPEFIDPGNIEELRGINFVFLCLDKGGVKKVIVERLLEWRIPFVDATMGVDVDQEMLGGVLTVTTVTAGKNDHVDRRIQFSDANPDDDYSRNVQIADLNALNAALAVIKWKKEMGFYRDLRREHYATYTIDVDMLTNDEQLE